MPRRRVAIACLTSALASVYCFVQHLLRSYLRSMGVEADVEPWRIEAWLFLVLPAWWLVRVAVEGRTRARRSARVAAGLCPACGYDLRATPGRCPECGAEPAAASKGAA